MLLVQQHFSQIRRRNLSPTSLCACLSRMAVFFAMKMTNLSQIIRVRFGAAQFRLLIEPLGKMQGSRGIFVFRENYEPLLKFGGTFLKSGGVAIDLGANQGIYACAFATAVGSEGRVVAVEPIPRQVARLKKNLEINNCTNVVVIEGAISDASGSAELRLNSGDTAASIVWGAEDKTIEVRTYTIDEIVDREKLERVDFIKLDVEGAELLALHGAKQTLSRFKPALSLEVSTHSAAVLDFLRGEGYAFFEFNELGDLVPVVKVNGGIDCLIALHAARTM